ncbi:MAG: BrnA antitoxin family protein [Candidatus Nitrosotenuis sp.]|nr:BrnA antitoxin family protein [Candidatus Nitrosotenuis sp.]
MDTSTVKRKPHPNKKETTRSITYRLPERMVVELDTEAMQRGISQNVLVRQIIEKFLQWDRFASKIALIPVPRKIMETLGVELEGEDIHEIIKVIKPVIKESVLFMKGKYDLRRCIETLEDYMRASGMVSDHRIEGSIHHFIVQHELGMKWSLFTEQLLKEIFHEFLPDTSIKFQTTETTVITSIALGSDWSEHEY